MRSQIEVVVVGAVANDVIRRVVKAVALVPGVVSVAEMKRDEDWGYEAIEETRVRGPEVDEGGSQR